MSRGFSTKEAASEIFLDQVMGLAERSCRIEVRRTLSDEHFEKFRWIYSEDDFQRYRSVVDNLVSSLSHFAVTRRDPHSAESEVTFGELWRRFKLTWNRLSDKQKEAATSLRMGIRKATFKHVAVQLGIGTDALKERWDLVKRRFRKAFPEFKRFYPSKTHTKSKKGSFIYWGLYRHQSAAVIHEVLEARFSASSVELTTSTPALYSGPKREKTKEFLEWERYHRWKVEAVAKLDEPVDLEELAIAKKADEEETNKTPDLYAVFRPDAKRHRDLSIVSPLEDDAPTPP